MCGAIPPLPQYAFMVWCSVKKSTGATLPLLRACHRYFMWQSFRSHQNSIHISVSTRELHSNWTHWWFKCSNGDTKHHAMKTYEEMEVYLHAFLTSALDGCEWSASRPGRFTPGKELPIPIRWEAGWTPEDVWTRWQREKKNPFTAGNRTPVVQPVA
jgi:hypothetical protein